MSDNSSINDLISSKHHNSNSSSSNNDDSDNTDHKKCGYDEHIVHNIKLL